MSRVAGNDPGIAKRALRNAHWLAALTGCLVSIFCFAPGFLSWDSAYQWQQARTGVYDALHPPLFTLIWAALELWWSGPISMLVLQQGMIWAGLALVASALTRSPAVRTTLVLVVGFWPPLWALSAHIWKDLPMMAAMALALGFLAADLDHPSGWKKASALLMLAVACACRHNALSAALPLLAWLGWRMTASGQRSNVWASAARGACMTAVLTVMVMAAAYAPNYAPGVQRTKAVWSVVALWDLSAVSIASGKLLIPSGFVLPDTSIAELEAHIDDYTNTTVFNSGMLIPTLAADFAPSDIDRLRQRWLSLPFAYPEAYLRHRLRLAELLFGLDNAALPDHQVLSMGYTPLEGNPPVVVAPRPAREALYRWLQARVDGPMFMGWIYLAVAAALVAMVALRRSAMSGRQLLAAVTALSALGYALPLAVISGSAEFRYLAWPIQATFLALALFWAAPRMAGHKIPAAQ